MTTTQTYINAKQVEISKPRLLLGKRFKKDDKNSDDENEQEFDLMKQARKRIAQRSAQEQALKKKNDALKQSSENDNLQEKKLQNIDPYAQKLFTMLPPPKKSEAQSISSALRSENTDIQVLGQDLEDDQNDLNDEFIESEENLRQNVVNIKGSDLVDKEQFYRNQMKKHSLQQFRDQTLQRLKRYGDDDQLAQKGKSKNQLATLGSEHMDMVTQLQDNKSNNLNEFRQKRARYGW